MVKYKIIWSGYGKSKHPIVQPVRGKSDGTKKLYDNEAEAKQEALRMSRG